MKSLVTNMAYVIEFQAAMNFSKSSKAVLEWYPQHHSKNQGRGTIFLLKFYYIIFF